MDSSTGPSGSSRGAAPAGQASSTSSTTAAAHAVDRPSATAPPPSTTAAPTTLGDYPRDASASTSASASASASGSGLTTGGSRTTTRFRRQGSLPSRPQHRLSIDTAGHAFGGSSSTSPYATTFGAVGTSGGGGGSAVYSVTGDSSTSASAPLGSRITVPTTKISKSDDERDPHDDAYPPHHHHHHHPGSTSRGHQRQTSYPHPNLDRRAGGLGASSDQTVVVSPAEHSWQATATRRKKTLRMSGDLGRQGAGVIGGAGAVGVHGHEQGLVGDAGATALLSHESNTSHALPEIASTFTASPSRDIDSRHSFEEPPSTMEGWTQHARSDSLLSEDEDDGAHHKSPSWWGGSSNPYELLSSKTPMRIPSGPRLFPPVIDQALRCLGLDVRRATRAPRKSFSDLTRPIAYTRRKEDTLAANVMRYIPTRLGTISFLLLCVGIFAVGLTVMLKYMLNPDKDPLPWRQYCLKDYPTLYSLQDPAHPLDPSMYSDNLSLAPLTHKHPAWPFGTHKERPYSTEPHSDLSELDPVGVFVGVFTRDSAIERRHLIRESYMSHWRSRPRGTEGVRVRFIMGRPREAYAKLIASEQEAFGDIVILDVEENMNSGKTYQYFTWASENAKVPHYEYPGSLSTPPVLKGEKRPNYVLKADDDAFIVLGELERHLRAAPRKKAYWGYLVKNQFMGGECYGLSIDLVDYIAASILVRSMTRGKEDKLIAKWIYMHPEKESIVWVTEKCYIYDVPQAGTVYSHGYLFPAEVQRIRQENATGLPDSTLDLRGGKDHAEAYSSVIRFKYYGFKYTPVRLGLSPAESAEGMIEGSPLSKLRDYNLDGSTPVTSLPPTLKTLRAAYDARLTRRELFLGDEEEQGGTVFVHYVKKTEWFLQTMAVLLGPWEEADLWRGRGSSRSAWGVRTEGGEGEGEGEVEVEDEGEVKDEDEVEGEEEQEAI